MKSSPFCLLAAGLAITAFSCQTAQAAIIVVAPTASTAGSLQITADINFTVTVAGNANVVILDEWVIADGTPFTQPNLSPLVGVSINAGPTLTGTSPALIDNGGANNATANDGWLQFDGSVNFPVIIGDVVTLKAGSYTIAANANFNPLASQTFTGNAFLANGSGRRRSADVSLAAVPEPTSGLLGLLGCGLLLRRRRK